MPLFVNKQLYLKVNQNLFYDIIKITLYICIIKQYHGETDGYF